MAGLTSDFTIRLKAVIDSSVTSLKSQIGSIQKSLVTSRSAFGIARDISQATEGVDRFGQKIRGLLEKPIEDFAEFETKIAEVQGQMGRDTAGLDRLKAAAIATGQTTRYSALQAAEGFKELTTQGFDVEQQLALLPVVLRAAAAGNMSVAEASHLTGSTLHQFGLSAKDAEDAMDIIQTAAASSATGLREMGETLKFVGPVAHAAGVSLKETSIIASLLANNGIESSLAGTAMRSSFLSMAKTTRLAKKELQTLGISQKEFSAGTKDPLNALKRLGDAMDKRHFTSDQKLGAITSIFGKENATAVDVLIEQAQKAGGSLAKLRAAQDDHADALKRYDEALDNTTSGKLIKLKNQMNVLGIELGERLSPALIGVANVIKPLLGDFSDWAKANPSLVSGIGGLAIGAAALAVPISLIGYTASTLVTTFGLLIPVVSGLALPFRLLGDAVQGTNTRLAAGGSLMGGATEKVVGLTKALQLAGAASSLLFAAGAGYEFGTMLDGLIGKLFDFKEGTLSAHMAVKGGEAAGGLDLFASTRTPEEDKAFKEGIIGRNIKRNQDEAAADADAEARARLNGSPAVGSQQQPFRVTPSGASREAQYFENRGREAKQFNAVTGAIEIKVTDDRVKVTTRSRGGVSLPVGHNP